MATQSANFTLVAVATLTVRAVIGVVPPDMGLRTPPGRTYRVLFDQTRDLPTGTG